MDEGLRKVGFNKCESDPCVYWIKTKDGIAYVGVYVDDMLTACENKKIQLTIRKLLNTHFETKCLGPIHYLLEIKAKNSSDEKLFFTQKGYIDKLMKYFNMILANPVSTPIEPKIQTRVEEDRITTTKPFKELIGSLSYVSHTTRPDISFSVSYLAQRSTNPFENDWKMAF